jgi:uroporphyrinogen-III synthase
MGNDMHWLLTRPKGHNAFLETSLKAQGHKVSVMPALVIDAWDAPDEQLVWQQLDDFDAILFTSANAVEHFARALVERRLAWPSCQHFAIGKATCRHLAEKNMTALSPSTGVDSESLLAMPEVLALSGGRLLLVSGVGGRGLLEPELAARNVDVARLSLYRRFCNPEFVWPQEKVDGVLVTSLESWHCLLRQGLLETPSMAGCMVIAGSQRIAQESGRVARTQVAASPQDEDMLALLQERSR